MNNLATYQNLTNNLQIGTYFKAADKIAEIYLSNLEELPKLKRQHFLSRLVKVYGENPEWMSKIGDLSYWLAKDVESIFDDYVLRGNYENSIESFINLRSTINTKTEAKQRGNDWILQNQEKSHLFMSYQEILMKTNIVFRLKGEYGFNAKILNEIRKWLIDNWESQINFIMENPEIFRFLPVQTINTFYYMDSLRWIDPVIMNLKEVEFLSALKKEYSNLNDQIEFNNYLYALTHIVIGKSWFYEYKLPTYREKYSWIVDFFEVNENRIFNECISDIIIEIGVIFYICNEIQRTNRYKKYAISKIEKGIIPSNTKTENEINSAEHTNILAIMLLRGF
jgi:hypothetical protein